MFPKYSRLDLQGEKGRTTRIWTILRRIILPISIAVCALLLLFVLFFDLGAISEWLNQLRLTSPLRNFCSPTTADGDASASFLGPYVRKFNAPDAAPLDHAKPQQDYSLLEEARSTDNGGFLRLREPSGRVGYYGVSMYHQLHCIKMLRDRIEGKGAGHEHGHHSPSGKTRRVIDDQVTPDHLIHCLDYISQAVVCAADGTVEPARIKKLPDGFHIAVIDGAETVHHCRNSKALGQMVKDSEANPINISELEPGVTVAMLAGTQ